MIKWIHEGKEREGKLINVSVMGLEKPPYDSHHDHNWLRQKLPVDGKNKWMKIWQQTGYS